MIALQVHSGTIGAMGARKEEIMASIGRRIERCSGLGRKLFIIVSERRESD
jgi:hypothetical protein